MIKRLVQEHQLSERRACKLVGLSRDSYRHPPQPNVQNQALKDKIIEIAHVRRRFGYRRVHDLLRCEFPGVNHKRVYRLYSAANLAVRKRKKAKRPVMERTPLNIARSINEVWSMDFVSDSLANGRRIKCLTVADDFSHECIEIAVDYGISGLYVTRLLDKAACFRGYPAVVRTDNVLNASVVSTKGNSIAYRSGRSDRRKAKSNEQSQRCGSAACGCLG
ncbi:MAG: hypothetical protein C4K60_20060 [Ideonella sp. MAG2]|nr:MAG: hypothetical protein C4K60_20060 [Ideonella sp. MAG2]